MELTDKVLDELEQAADQVNNLEIKLNCQTLREVRGLYTVKEEHRKALDCMVQHIRIFLDQSYEGRTANFGESCERCRYLKECNLDWLSIMDPLLMQSSVGIRLVHSMRTNTPDSNRESPHVDSHPHTDMKGENNES